MENIGTTFYVVLSIIGVIGMLIVYAIYSYKRMEKSRALLHGFLEIASQSFEDAWKLHHQDEGRNREIAEVINQEMQRVLEEKFITLLPQLHRFPTKGFILCSSNHITNDFMGQIFGTIKELHDDHKTFGAGLDGLALEFSRVTKRCILSQLEKQSEKVTTK